MFGLGFGHILLLLAIALIVLGPEQMPQLARVIGKTIAELKKALNEATSSIVVDLKDQNKPQNPDQPVITPKPADGTVAHIPAKTEPARSGVHNAAPAPVDGQADGTSPDESADKKDPT